MTGRTETLTVEAVPPGERLDSFLRRQFPVVSRGTIQRLIEQGHVRVNDLPSKSSHKPRPGETIQIHFPEARPTEVQPEELPLEILFEDADLLVLNKAPGVVVHPAAGNEEHTLVNALLHHCAGQLSGIGGVARPGIVHRLDKDTSGCLVVAKNDRTHLGLAAQFEGRTVDKRYHAIICGILPNRTGEICAAIARHPSHRKRMAVTDGGGREARTGYSIIESLAAATVVEALLHTGRTHQIRVHFQHLGYPLVGDLTYGTRQNARLTEQTGYTAPRLMLHARFLAFQHPARSRPMKFEAPLPDDFKSAWTALGGKQVPEAFTRSGG